MQTFSKNRLMLGAIMAFVIAVPTLLPTNAAAQTSHRQKSKNQWRNLGIAGGALGVAGLVTHNKTLAIGGLAGGAYSAYRYEHDRKSQRHQQDRYDRRHRAQHFSHARYSPHHGHNDNRSWAHGHH